MRDLFGRIQRRPEQLTQPQRVDVLRTLAGSLQADERADMRWLGTALATWLRCGGPLDAALGVKAPQGSRTTPQALVRRDEVARLLLDLSHELGSDAKAIRALRGHAPCTGTALDMVQRLQALGAPASKAAFTRARQLVSLHAL